MPRVKYVMRTNISEEDGYSVDATIEDGMVAITIEAEIDDDDLLVSPDASGDCQSDMLWEAFDHYFTVFDSNGDPVEYED